MCSVRSEICICISSPLPAKVMFSRLSVGLSVFLSVWLLATLRKNGLDFREIFRIGGTWYCEHSETIWECSIKPFPYGIFVSNFSGESVSVRNITEKGWADFHEICRAGWLWDKEQTRTFWGVAFNTFDPALILIFSRSVLDSNIMGKQVNGFSWNFQDMSSMAQQNSWLDCFTSD